jgi:hypothetical protein
MFNLKKAVTVLLGATVLITATAGMASADVTDGQAAAGAKAANGGQGQSLHEAIAKLERRAQDRETFGVTASAETFDCTYDVKLESKANRKFVSAEFGYWGGGYAMLRARADSAGAWERFSMCRDGSGYYSFQSEANGLWVTAELNYTGGDYAMLRANASWVRTWEKFQLVAGVNGGFALKNLGNGRYVSAELNYWGSSYAMLRARAYSVGLWESFA